jgi:secondary thiamine-phosphate synthase enzyme
MNDQIAIQTQTRIEVVNVTKQLQERVGGIEDGLALFYLPHTSAALLISEDDEELRQDFVRIAENWLANLRPFAHVRNDNPNTEAHILSAFGGTQITVAISDGSFDLGRYQQILLLELDGPKTREIRSKIMKSG